MVRVLVVLAACVAPVAIAQPELTLEATKWSDGSLGFSVVLSAPSMVAVGSERTPWHQAVQLEVTDSSGAGQQWPLTRNTPTGSQIMLARDRTYSVSFKLEPASVKALPAGVYEVVAVLDLRGSDVGWHDVARSPPTDVSLGAGPRAPTPTKDVATILRELSTKQSPLQRRELVLALEGALLDAPELSSGALLDGAVKAHLLELGKRMARGDGVYRTDREADGPRNVLGHRAVRLTPGRVTPQFKVQVQKTTITPALDATGFWQWIHDGTEEGLIVHPVRARDGVVRVATSAVPSGGPASQSLDVSFWRQNKAGWELVSYEPWPQATREWNANVRRSGDAPRAKSELSDVERAQWLELRLGLAEQAALERRESIRGEALIHRAFGAWVFDEAYVPLLQKRLGVGTASRQGAVVGLLGVLKSEVPLMMALDLHAQLVSDEQRGAVAEVIGRHVARLEPTMRSVSASEIDPSEERRARTAKVVDDLAVVTVGSGFAGSKTLFRRTEKGWVEVVSLGSWVQ